MQPDRIKILIELADKRLALSNAFPEFIKEMEFAMKNAIQSRANLILVIALVKALLKHWIIRIDLKYHILDRNEPILIVRYVLKQSVNSNENEGT